MSNGPGINPYTLAGIANTLRNAKANVALWKQQDALDKAKHVGETTEEFKDKTRDIKQRIAERLGRPSGLGIGDFGELTKLAPLDPATKAGIVGVTKLLGMGRDKKQARRAIKDSEKILGELDSKYEKSWLGNYMKDFVSGYEQQFTDMRQDLPSGGEMIMGSIFDGLMAYGEAGGKKEQERIDAGGTIPGWAGGLFKGSTPDTTTSSSLGSPTIDTSGMNFDALNIPEIDFDTIVQQLLTYNPSNLGVQNRIKY